MAKPNPSLYSISKTFIWFAVMSILLTATLVGIVWVDYSRDWKKYQKEFTTLKLQKSAQELKNAAGSLDKKKLSELEKELKSAEEDLKSHQSEIRDLQKEISSLDTALSKKKADFQNLKQYQDSYRYFFEDYTAHNNPKADDYFQKLKQIEPQVLEAKSELESAEKAKSDKELSLQTFLEKSKSIQRQIDGVLEEKNRAEKKLAKVQPSLAKDALNAPMLDFLAPTLKVQQIVLDNLYDDYHFAKTQKVDRCTTCHLGIDQKGFEDAPQPFRTHPDLETYLGASSPHPVEKFGCTVCHGGSGHSVNFKNAAHTPRDEKQAQEWKRKHDWQALEKWDQKMLPLPHTQAACAKCHQGALEIPKADKLNEGRHLANVYGCFNCHKIGGYETRWNAGSSLEKVAIKLEKDWVIKWLNDPRSFRDSTKMPRIFHLSNTSSPEDVKRNHAAVQAIADYLFKHSKTLELGMLSLQGNAQNGEKLVKEVGCLGCHSLPGIEGGHFAAELSGMGSKVTPEWLYQWLKDPKHISKTARMPNLRLTDQEAADITAFLLTFKNETFEKQAVPSADPAVRNQMIVENFQASLSKKEAEEKLNQMSEEDRWLFLGEKSIAHQGCFSCHTIKGFDGAKPIGAELTKEGQKDIHQFDFGFTHLEHTRHDWLNQKIRDPRIFDQGKQKAYYEKLRMPQFNFSDEQIDSLTTFLLSLSDEAIPMEMRKVLDIHEQKIEKGRFLAAKLNCAGCHTLDGHEGTLRTLTEDKGQAPPVLDGEGEKVQEKWLDEFLKNPYTIRPWLHYRMPTFGLTDEETRALVEYFSYLDNQEMSYKGFQAAHATPEVLEAGKSLFDQLQCAKCHQTNPESLAMGASFLAPDLKLTKTRLKPEWVKKWLTEPQVLQADTMMPTFFADGQTPLPEILEGDAQKQIEAIRDYLYAYDGAAENPKSS